MTRMSAPGRNAALGGLMVCATLALAACTSHNTPPPGGPEAKLFVALEGAGSVAVLDPATGTLLATVELPVEDGGMVMAADMLMPHNVQVAPDGESVWITANAMEEEDGHGAAAAGDDEVIVLDPADNSIMQRIPLGMEQHLAHVVLAPDSSTALVVAQQAGKIYRIDAATFTVSGEAATSEGAEPHGLRVAPDGMTAYVALMGSGGLGILDLDSFTLEELPLDGKAVQTAVTPDGKYALASLYDTRKLARVDCATREVMYLDLPAEARGPVQIYPAPDSRHLWVADQGYYFEQPEGNQVYGVDLETMAISATIEAGRAPHGIVVSADGATAYVTNLLGGDVSVLDLAGGMEMRRISVGEMPNGVSLWEEDHGGRP